MDKVHYSFNFRLRDNSNSISVNKQISILKRSTFSPTKQNHIPKFQISENPNSNNHIHKFTNSQIHNHNLHKQREKLTETWQKQLDQLQEQIV